MTTFFQRIIFLCAVALACVFAKAQDTTALAGLTAYARHFTAFSKDYPQEKAYLHFDNTSYYLGETIWFKAYVVRADRNCLTNLSKVLYVELLNAEGHLMDSRKLKIENGQCHGEFKLNPAQYGGFYEVRAYTRYMLNFGDGNLFSRVFPVYDKPKTESEYKTTITERAPSQRIEQKRPGYKQNRKVELSFFPEGGSLVSGISSKVAFKATTAEGEEIPVNCTLYKNKKDSICSFAAWHHGMGSFEFVPDSGDYSVVATWKNKTYSLPLPKVLNSGITMSVDNSDNENIYMLIAKSPDIKSRTLGLTITCRGFLYGSDAFTMSSDSVLIFNLPKRKLPSGVTQITLFDAQGKILSERLIFVNHHSQMKFSCSQNKSQYNPFEPVSLAFHLQDYANEPVETTFSLSVRDAATSNVQPQADNVLTDLLLSSELRGYIQEPAYYFESEDSVHRAALDLLMLVQGWSRYSWKQMAGVEKIEHKQPLEEGLYLDGSVVSLFRKKAIPDMDFSLILMADSTSQQGKCKTDSIGNFAFMLHDFSGSAHLIMQTKQNQKKKETYIKLNRQFSPSLKAYSFAEQNSKQVYKTIQDTVIVIDSLLPDFDNELKKLLPANNAKMPLSKRNNLLKQVTVKAKRMPVKISARYEVEKEIDRRTDQAEWLPANLNNLLNFSCEYYHDGSYKSKKVIFITEKSQLISADVNKMVEGMEDEDAFSTESKLTDDTKPSKDEVGRQMPDLDEIESVTFIEDYASIFRLYRREILDVTKICLGLIKLKKNYVREPYSIRNTTFDGYSHTREFFSPQYDKVVLPDEKDYRRTLYWNPDVKTDKDGKASVTFYNNSSCRSMLINAETVTANGAVGVMNK